MRLIWFAQQSMEEGILECLFRLHLTKVTIFVIPFPVKLFSSCIPQSNSNIIEEKEDLAKIPEIFNCIFSTVNFIYLKKISSVFFL